MATRVVPVCSKCGKDVLPRPALGHRQGQLLRIALAAITWQITLCETCIRPLFDLYEEYVELVLPDGTVQGADKLEFLPRVDMDGVGVEPPSFSEQP